MRILIHQQGDNGFKGLNKVDPNRDIIEVLIINKNDESFSITDQDGDGLEIRIEDGKFVINPISVQRIALKIED